MMNLKRNKKEDLLQGLNMIKFYNLISELSLKNKQNN